MKVKRLKIGRLVISFGLVKRGTPQKGKVQLVKTIYAGRVCDICKVQVVNGQKANHLAQYHPEYKFWTEHRDGSCNVTYICATCNITVGGVAAMVRHYQQRHPKGLNLNV